MNPNPSPIKTRESKTNKSFYKKKKQEKMKQILEENRKKVMQTGDKNGPTIISPINSSTKFQNAFTTRSPMNIELPAEFKKKDIKDSVVVKKITTI